MQGGRGTGVAVGVMINVIFWNERWPLGFPEESLKMPRWVPVRSKADVTLLEPRALHYFKRTRASNGATSD